MRLWKQREHPAILLFHQLNRAYHNATLAQMAQHNVQDVGNPMLLFILAQCAEQPEGTVPSQKKLAELLHVSPATVANSLKSLERGGYVRKEPDPSDARCNRVYITDKGLQAVQTCVTVFDTVDQQVLRGFSPAELELLRDFNQRMLDNLRQIGGDCDSCPPGCPPPPPVPPSHGGPFSNGKE